MKKTFKFKRIGRKSDIGLPGFPSASPSENPEVLLGRVGDLEASAPEERLARALDKARLSYQFRLTAGAPRGLPGWKELDFVISANGLLYAFEVDTAFTHRQKENADVLHDAIILNDPYLRSMGEFYPRVIHVDGDSDLASMENAQKYVKAFFGTAASSFTSRKSPMPSYNFPQPLKPVYETPYVPPQSPVIVPPTVLARQADEDEARKQKNARTIAQRAARNPVAPRKR